MPTFASDKFRVVLYAANREALAQLVLNRLLDIGPLRESPETGEIEVEVFITEEQIAQLKQDGARLGVHENLSEVGRNRQKEVGTGDRFEAGKALPEGLGARTRWCAEARERPPTEGYLNVTEVESVIQAFSLTYSGFGTRLRNRKARTNR